MAIALVFGGGGSPSAAAEIIVQLAFAAAVGLWIIWAGKSLTIASRGLALLAVFPLGLACVQLVPLPPVLWQALPGRALAVRSLGLVDARDIWLPWSLAPAQTLAALLALVPPLGVMLATARLGRRDRHAVILLVAMTGLAAAALGAAQLGAQGSELRLYEQANRGWITGFFANRNSAADFFLIAALAVATWCAGRESEAVRGGKPRRIAEAVGLALLATALVLTGSRAGIALALPTAAIILHIRGDFRRLADRRRRVAAVLAGVIALASVAILALPRLAGVAERFAVTGDFRFELWNDAWAAAERYFPFGSGLGTFVTAYLPVESLELVDQTYPTRAHTELLELAIEAGVPGLLILTIMLGVLRKLWKASGSDPGVVPAHRLFAGGILLVTGLHSLVDYPLRSMALACLAGIAAGLLVAPYEKGRGVDDTGRAE